MGWLGAWEFPTAGVWIARRVVHRFGADVSRGRCTGLHWGMPFVVTRTGTPERTYEQVRRLNAPTRGVRGSSDFMDEFRCCNRRRSLLATCCGYESNGSGPGG